MAPRLAIAPLIWTAGCSGRPLQPALLLQLGLLTRTRLEPAVHEQRRELTLTAALELPFDPAVVRIARAPPLLVPGSSELEPAAGPTLDCDPGADPLCAWAQHAEQETWAQLAL